VTCVWKGQNAVVDTLEMRTLMSSTPVSVSEVSSPGGTQLQLAATSVNSHITLTEAGAGLLVGNGAWSQTIVGQFQSIVIHGGGGTSAIVVDASVTTDCTLFGGSAKNVLQAGSGDDVLVCIGSKADTLIGGSGRDSFWADANAKERIVNVRPDETAEGDVHRVASFWAAPVAGASRKVGRTPKRVGLAEPATTDGSTYQDFSSHPLFGANGPSENDIFQGQVGDCFYLSVLSSVAKVDPWRIRQSVLDMGDGTYLVQISKGSSDVYIHVDGELPVRNGMPDYAGLGSQGSIWVAIMEKAYATFEGPTTGYAAINGGWMDQSYASLGSSSQTYLGGTNAADMMNRIEQELAAGESVTYGTGTIAAGAPLIGGHAYTVDTVNVDSHGNLVGLTLRNPWGIAGAGTAGNNNGYVTVTATQAYDSLEGVVSAFV
jgi:hypothetical protein